MESHDVEYEEWQVERVKEEPKKDFRYEPKEEVPARMSEMEKRRKELA